MTRKNYTVESVSVYNTQKKYPIDFRSVEAIASEVICTEKRSCHDVSLHYVGVKRICSLHAEYFDDPSITDCISFPIDNDDSGPYTFLGEVFVCPHTAFEYVKSNGGELYEEITLYTVHGLLHLLGYDDIEEMDRKTMREKESLHMENLKKKKLILRHTI